MDNTTDTKDYFPYPHSYLKRRDSIQDRLNDVNRRLARPAFLADLSCSRLPSQAASESSLSPAEVPHHSSQETLHPVHARRRAFGYGNLGEVHEKSPLHRAVEFANLNDIDPCRLSSGHSQTVATAVLEHDFKGDEEAPSVEWKQFQELQELFLSAWPSFLKLKLNIKMASDRGYATFDHGHKDLVLAVDFNFYGNRMVTASSDHRLKVYDRKDESWNLIDTWRAHHAEIVDVKWNGPFTGSILGSVAEDGQFKLWEEDLLEPPHSGRRFKDISRTRSETRVPYCSLDFKNIHTETYVALITRDGYLSIFEPIDHDNLGSDWSAMMQRYVCATPSRQDETGFRVSWHKEKVPCWTAVEAGLDRKALSLAVAAMDKVKIYRTDKDRKWYQAAELTGARSIIRDVAWANGSMRGFDIIATASKDGAVRVYELLTPSDGYTRAGADAAGGAALEPAALQSLAGKARANAPSGLAAGLAGAAASGSRDAYRDAERHVPGRVRHEVRKVAELMAHGGAVWRVAFSQLGDLLVSTGDDGSVRTWKKALNDEWLEYAKIELTQDG